MADVTLEVKHTVDLWELTQGISRLGDDDIAAFAKDMAYELFLHDEEKAERFARVFSATITEQPKF